jgi:cytochrome P450
VRAALLDPETFMSPPKTFKVTSFGVALPQVPLPCGTRTDHARYGRVLRPLFSPTGFAPFAPVLRVRAATLIDTVAATGQCDATNLADAFASHALLTVCGLPADLERAAQLIRAAVIGDADGAAELELFNWLDSGLGAGMRNPRRPPGILRPLVEGRASDKNFPLGRVEVAAVVLLLFCVAGIEMVAAAIGFWLLRLARDPHLQAQLREDSAQLPAFVEGMFRLEVPGPALPRVTTREVNIGGVTIPARQCGVARLGRRGQRERRRRDSDGRRREDSAAAPLGVRQRHT